MRCALFSWVDHEASGGAGDFVRFGTLDELRAEAEQILLLTSDDAVQIADAVTMRVICWAELVYEPSPLTGQPATRYVRWVFNREESGCR